MKSSVRYLIYLSIYFLLIPVVFSQTSRPMRMEFTCQEDQQPFDIINLGSFGCLLMYKTENQTVKDQFKWNFTLYDVNFRLSWTKEYDLPESFDFKKSARTPGQDLCLLFHNTGRKGNLDEIRLLSIMLKNGDIKESSILTPQKSTIADFKILKDQAIIAINTHEDQSQVIMKSLSGTASKPIIPEQENKTFVREIRVDTLRNTFSVSYFNFLEKKHATFIIKTFNDSGRVNQRYQVDAYEAGKSINNGKFIVLDSNRVMVMGDYSNERNKSLDDLQKGNEESTGLYSAVFYKGNLVKNNFYNFLDFKHFFNKIRANQAIYEVEGKPKNKEISSNYRILCHDIIERGQEIILLTEAYYPEYHTVTNWTYDYYGRMVPNYYSVFDGFRYNNAFITGFDTTGALQWDNSLEINNLLTQTIQQRINLLFDDKEIVLVYSSGGKIVSKVIQRGETVSQTESVELEQLDNRDRLLDDDESMMDHWYRNIMLCYGYQKIKNSSRTDNRRNVFYLSKIAYR